MRALQVSLFGTALFLGLAFFAAADSPRTAAAADRSGAAVPAPEFGTSSLSRLTLGACDAQTTTIVGPSLERSNCVMAYPAVDGALDLAFPIHLPTGALIERVEVRYWDALASDPFLGMFRVTPDGGSLDVVSELPLPDFSGGFSTALFMLPAGGHTVDNNYPYMIITTVNRTGDNYQGIVRFSIDYRLQVSPAPGAATFSDVPTNHPFFQFVEALAASGITGGCGTGIYCPNQPVTRGQMAVFLSKALGLHFPN